jgi:hypothetical protein
VAGYVPFHMKKRYALAAKEQRLRRLLQSGTAEEKVVRAAEAVRAARVRVLRAVRAQIPANGKNDSQIAKLDDKISAVLALPIAAILAESNPAMQNHPPKA